MNEEEGYKKFQEKSQRMYRELYGRDMPELGRRVPTPTTIGPVAIISAHVFALILGYIIARIIIHYIP